MYRFNSEIIFSLRCYAIGHNMTINRGWSVIATIKNWVKDRFGLLAPFENRINICPNLNFIIVVPIY